MKFPLQLLSLATCGLSSLEAQTTTFNFSAEVSSYTSYYEEWINYPTDFLTTPRGTASTISGSITIDYSTPDYAPGNTGEGRYISGLYRNPSETEPGNPETNLTDFSFSIGNESGDVFSDTFTPKAALTEIDEITYYSPSALTYNNSTEVLNIAGIEIPIGSDVIHLTSWQQTSSSRGYSNREIHLLFIDEGGTALDDIQLPEAIDLNTFDTATVIYRDEDSRGSGTSAYHYEDRSLTANLTQFSSIPEPTSAFLLTLVLPALLIRRR